MTEIKVTKKMVLEAIIALATNEEFLSTGVTMEDIVNYATKTIEQLDAKAAKAKEASAKKKAEGDELLAIVKDALTNEYKTGAEILADIAESGFADVTQAKVTARLTKLCKAGEAHKTDIKVDGRKIKGYAIGEAPAEDAE